MSTVDVLMMVDVEGALASGNLSENIYLVDTNGYLGSYNEGQDELSTKLHNGDTVVWSVAPIDPGTNATIASFSGTAVSDQIHQSGTGSTFRRRLGIEVPTTWRIDGSVVPVQRDAEVRRQQGTDL